jgi:hypothetical protein
VLDFVQYMRDQLSPEIRLRELLLQASERQSDHIGSCDRNPFKLRLCSNSPDPFMLLTGQ